MENVHLVGPVPNADVPALMAGFDVSIVPHMETPFTESLNPIKLWEYLAAGKPIVATNVAGFRDYPGLVMTASGAEAFTSACRAALSEDASLPERRQSEAARNTWGMRVERLERILEEAGLW